MKYSNELEEIEKYENKYLEFENNNNPSDHGSKRISVLVKKCQKLTQSLKRCGVELQKVG